MRDTIYCRDKEEAKRTIDQIGGKNILKWEFIEHGAVLMYVKDTFTEGKEKE